ncbi:MAG TPA: hypothetical protein VFD05_01625 [Bacilli bacterium]|nr:hypothetical protein [Bacilli bacterium]
MKKLKIMLGLVLAGAFLHGCGSSSLEFGFGAVATYGVAEDTPGADVETEINYVAATFDKKGVIQDLRLDTVQIKVAREDEALVLVDNVAEGKEVLTKWDLLEDYGMKDLSTLIGIGKEWYEQAESFEKWTVGKTVAEVKAKVQEDHSLEGGVDVGVSIHVNGFVDALEVAAANKVKVQGKVAALGVGGVNTISGTEPDDGYDYTVAGAAFDKDKKVVAARIDTFQLLFDSENKEEAVMDETQVQIADGVIRGKQELKEEYGMKGLSSQIGIGKEWYEQAAALADHLIGKTVNDALGAGETIANGADVGVSITVSHYRDALLRAEHSAFNKRY